MASYSLEVKRSAAKELAGVPRRDLVRIVAKIEDLGREPRPQGAEKLSNDDKYRIRQGDYRVLYQIDEANKRVIVVRIAHRREVYR